jgi:hypothetical protein
MAHKAHTEQKKTSASMIEEGTVFKRICDEFLMVAHLNSYHQLRLGMIHAKARRHKK